MATYKNNGEGMALIERPLYGSSRVGMDVRPVTTRNTTQLDTGVFTRYLTQKQYELSDHLGNVRTVVKDVKYNTGGVFSPDIASNQNYYAFGMLQEERIGSAASYRYGYNGKEKDDEMKGSGVQYDYGFRIYDANIAKFLSVDPLTKSFPWYTPYQFAGNKPIWALDLDGKEEWIYQYRLHNNKISLITKVHNLQITPIPACTSCVKDVMPSLLIMNIATGKIASGQDFGTIQYKYLDVNGKPLDIRRKLDGSFESGRGENLPMHSNSFPMSSLVTDNPFVYIGQYNPVAKVNGTSVNDYRREPVNLVDAAALQHDKDYDAVNAKGPEDAMSNPHTLDADIRLVKSCLKVIMGANTGVIDPYTGQKISNESVYQANLVASAFILLVAKKGAEREAEKLRLEINEVMKDLTKKIHGPK